MGIGIAFRKSILRAAGGFNEKLQVFEWLEMSLRIGRAGHFTTVKIPELTVLHLEPPNRFTLGGFLRRRVEYGFWYHSLYYLHPKRLSFYAFPVKLTLLLAVLAMEVVIRNPVFLLAGAILYLAWTVRHYHLLEGDNVAAFAASNFSRLHEKVYAYFTAVAVLSLGELAGEVGKLWSVFKSPTKEKGGAYAVSSGGSTGLPLVESRLDLCSRRDINSRVSQ